MGATARPRTCGTLTAWSCRAVVALIGAAASGQAAAAVPGPPSSVTATPGNAKATVNFAAPTSDGGAGITSYTATSSPGAITATTTKAFSGALLHFDGSNGSTTFTDVNGHTVSANGSAALETTRIRFGTAALSLGSGFASIANSSGDLDVASNDFTVEAWGYLTAVLSSDSTLCAHVPAATVASGAFQIKIQGNTGYAGFSFGNGTSGWVFDTYSTTAVSTGTWHHFALVRHGSSFTLYLDGNSVLSTSSTTPILALSDPINVGGYSAALPISFNGYVDEFRFTNGTAVYTANFTVPTAALSTVAQAGPIIVTGLTNNTAYTFTVTATNSAGTGSASAASNSVTPSATVTGGLPGTPTIGTATAGNAQATVSFTAPASDGANGITSYTATSNPGSVTAKTTASSPGALLHMDGTNGGTTFTDVLGHAFSVLGGSPVTSTTTYDFGGSSFFPGTSGYIGTGGAADWVFSGDYTMEMWQYVLNTTDVRRIMGQSTWQFHHNGHIYFFDGGWRDLGPFPGTNVWYHVAVARQGANCYGFVNGTLTASWTNSASFGGNSEGLWIGHVNGSAEYAPNMYIDEVRIVNGSAVYTSNFTPPAAPLSPVAKANPITVTGLQPGTTYTFTVTATNPVGTGRASAASNAVTVPAPPGAPTIGAATAGNAAATVTFTTPLSNGGSPITSYTATATPGGKTATGSASPITVTGLANKTAYTFTVTATNSAGTGPASTASNSVTPDVGPTVSISTPSNGATASAPATFSLTAAAAPGLSGETISSVQYYANGTPIGPPVTTSPYSYSWADVGAGTYNLTAVATDNYGTARISSLVSVTVQESAKSVKMYYIYADQIDTPRIITRPSDNQVVWRWDGADPFGAAQPNQNPANLGVFVYNERFPGQLYDAESATHYNYFRNYDPGIGRYVQSDPIGLGGGFNTYGYVLQNPLTLSDRHGLETCDGYWSQAGEFIQVFDRFISPVCKCFWLCYSCLAPDVIWSGNIFDLPSSTGVTLIDYQSNKLPNASSPLVPGSGLNAVRPTWPARGAPSGGPAGGTPYCQCQPPGPETRCQCRKGDSK